MDVIRLYCINTYVHAYYYITVDRENFVVKKVVWDKSLTGFNFVKTECIACMSTKELRY